MCCLGFEITQVDADNLQIGFQSHCETRRVGTNNSKHWNVEILMERVVFWKVIIYHLFHGVKIPPISVDFSDQICNKKKMKKFQLKRLQIFKGTYNLKGHKFLKEFPT